MTHRNPEPPVYSPGDRVVDQRAFDGHVPGTVRAYDKFTCDVEWDDAAGIVSPVFTHRLTPFVTSGSAK